MEALVFCRAVRWMMLYEDSWVLTNKSSRVIPGFRGTPAGMTTISAPLRADPMLGDPKSEQDLKGKANAGTTHSACS